MDSDYDIFEMLPDSAPIWKGSVQGKDAALRELASQTEKSKNEIRVVHLSTGKVLASSAARPESASTT